MNSFKGGDDTMKRWIMLFALIVLAAAYGPSRAAAQLKKAESPSPAASLTTQTESQAESSTSEAAIAWQKVQDKIGKEMDDKQQGSTLFNKLDDVKKYIKDDPDYIYPAGEIRNPMVIPWRQREVIANQLMELAQKMMDKSEFDAAIAHLNRIIQEYPGSEVARIAQMKITDAMKQKLAVIPITTSTVNPIYSEGAVKPVTRPFPEEVKAKISGIIWSNKPQVLIGDDILDAGKTVPGYPDLIIKQVEKRKIVFIYDSIEYPIPLDAGMPNIKGIVFKKD
ncbi:MAG: hypothetical protein NTX50_13860 [Candidatus Sumerlaeota bacterium]|nr:hypothetical protein [Candidatus Sumerlaeota bacterium]